MSKDNIARGLANRAVENIGSVEGVAKLTTAERLALAPIEPTIVYDVEMQTYFGYNLKENKWVDLGIIGIPMWGLIQGDIIAQTDLINFLTTANIKEVGKLFVTQAEKNKWNGQSTTYIVSSVEELNTIQANIGDMGIILLGGKATGYLKQETQWSKLTDPAWENINISWSNIINAPNFDWRNF